GWYSTRCRLTLKLKATKCSRFYFQLAVSTPRTEETGSGLLPTPRTVMPLEREDARVMGNRILRKSGQDYGMNLAVMASKGLLPTPRSSPNENRQRKLSPSQKSGKHGLNLAAVAADGTNSLLNPLFVEEM